MRNVMSFINSDEKDNKQFHNWKLSDFSSCSPLDDKFSTSLCAISPDGNYAFKTGSLPPELFKKLDPLELAFYNQYWNTVSKLEFVHIPEDLVRPQIDPITGDAYVIKCYCDLDPEIHKTLPPLPYKLVKPSESVDVWSFGAFLFTLSSGGETVFQDNCRTGNTSGLKLATTWDKSMAERLVLQNVNDDAAQDLLLHILVPAEERVGISMESVLNHPFFTNPKLLSEEVKEYLRQARNDRELAGAQKKKQLITQIEAQKIKESTVMLSKVGVQSQLRIMSSATEVIKQSFDEKGQFSPVIPYSYIILPYELTHNEHGKIVPSSPNDFELAECFGEQLLELGKVSCFAARFGELLTGELETRNNDIIEKWALNSVKFPSETAIEMLRIFELDPAHFSIFATSFVAIVRLDTEGFISNPWAFAKRLVTNYIEPFKTTFDVPQQAFFYLIDEFVGLPLFQNARGLNYPHIFRENVSDIVYKVLPYMHTTATYMFCAFGGVEGVSRLILQGENVSQRFYVFV